MATLGIQKTQPVSTSGHSKKRPKYAPGSGTPKQRAILLGSAAACMLAAFLLPGSKEETADQKGFEEAVEQKAPPAPQAVTVNPFAIPRNATRGGQSRDPNFLPLTEVTMFAPTTPAEIDSRLTVLAKYYSHPNPKERDAAYKATVALGAELVSRLPQLIESATSTALINYAQAARDLKAVSATPALIARIEAKDKAPVARFEMFSALASFDDPKAQAYVTAAVGKSEFLTRDEIWSALGENMNEQLANLALKAIVAGGPDCFAAGKALARYGKTSERVSQLTPQLQPLLATLKGDARLALVKSVASMDPNSASNLLNIVTFDQDIAVRAAALAGMARSPNQQGIAVAAFKNEQDPTIKLALLQAFAEAPCEAILPDLIALLNDPTYRNPARTALMAANKGKDLGGNDFDWMDWLKERRTPKLTAQAEAR